MRGILGFDRTVIALLGVSSVSIQVYLENVTSQAFVGSPRSSSNTELPFLPDLIKIPKELKKQRICIFEKAGENYHSQVYQLKNLNGLLTFTLTKQIQTSHLKIT